MRGVPSPRASSTLPGRGGHDVAGQGHQAGRCILNRVLYRSAHYYALDGLLTSCWGAAAVAGKNTHTQRERERDPDRSQTSTEPS
eukprot:13406373-Heterocapsa_arctica.AAC.1